MDLNQELVARIKSACALDKLTTERDFQIRAGENGTVLINLRTGKADIIFDDDSKLQDFLL
jgi:hypothetical protein